jgi:predicted nucleic acid-binding protein
VSDYIVLDTDVASALQRNSLGADELDRLTGKVPCITFVTVGEFYKGAFKRGWSQTRIARYESWMRRLVVLPYDAGIAREWGEISAEGERTGRPIPSNDAWVAACCRRYDVPLMTGNRRHFESITGLSLV